MEGLRYEVSTRDRRGQWWDRDFFQPAEAEAFAEKAQADPDVREVVVREWRELRRWKR